MFVILGVVVVILTIYFLIKQYEARMVLFTSGVVMAILAGKPMAALDAFATRMTSGGLIMPICSVMGFAFVMKATGCDQHLVKLVAKGLYKVRFFLIPGATLATFAINIALPSAAGVSAAVGAILIPLLIASGVHPALAGAAVLSGTYGSMLSPGLSHNPFVAELAGVDVMDVIASHAPASIAAVIIAAISITIVAIVRKEHKGYSDEKVQAEANFEEKVNVLYAIVPTIPLIILVLGASVVPAIKMGVPQAMLIGTVIALIVTRKKPEEISKAFFNGMGNAYTNIMGIIICAAVFVSGMEAIGIVDSFIQFLINSESMVKLAASFGPFILAVIAGSGDAVTYAFNEAVTPHAAQFGLDIVNMGSAATLGGALGRTMSPITGATIVCAGIAGVSPMELAKRNAPGMIIAMVVAMLLLF